MVKRRRFFKRRRVTRRKSSKALTTSPYQVFKVSSNPRACLGPGDYQHLRTWQHVTTADANGVGALLLGDFYTSTGVVTTTPFKILSIIVHCLPNAATNNSIGVFTFKLSNFCNTTEDDKTITDFGIVSNVAKCKFKIPPICRKWIKGAVQDTTPIVNTSSLPGFAVVYTVRSLFKA